MALKVQVNSNPVSRLAAQVNTQPNINTRLKKIDLSLVKLEELTNVDENVNGLQDGYTLIYDADTQQWITQALTAQNVTINNIDGGTY
jgi:hypothetical protein